MGLPDNTYACASLSNMTTATMRCLADKTKTADFVGERCAQGVRRLPGWRAGDLPDRADIAAEGGKADIAKPLKGLGSGVMEIALPYRGNAFRVVYAVQIGAELWVVHAFQKKSTQGIKTPKHEIDLIAARVKRLKEMLR